MPPLNLDSYAKAAFSAGVTRDQFSRLARAGIVLQPQQLRAYAAARACDHPDGPTRVGMGGARGGGKSHWSLAQLVDDCLLFPGLKCLLLRKVGKSGQESFEDLSRQILKGVPCDYSASAGRLVFPNGSRIILGHYKDEKDVDKYLGLEYDVIAIEESTTLSASKHRNIRTCLRTSKDGWRPRIYETTNPGGISHTRFKKTFIDPARKGVEQDTRFIPATFRDNRFLNRDYVLTLNDLVGWQLKAWRDGDWDIAAGQYFDNWRHEIHVRGPIQCPKGWRVWCGMDYGFTHYTVVYLAAMTDDGEIVILDEHAERKQLPKHHAECIHAMLRRNGYEVADLWKFVAGADVFAKKGDREGLTIAEQYAEYGIYLTPANTDRINGAGELLNRLGGGNTLPSLFVVDRCTKLIECIPDLVHDENRPEDVLKVNCDENGDGGDDPYDGVRYTVMAAVSTPSWDTFLELNRAA